MNRTHRMIALLITILLPAGIAIAQKPEGKAPPASYRLNIVLSEVEGGKATNQRSFQMVVMMDNWGELRTGTRVPVVTAPPAGKEGPQIVYMDVGFSAQARILEREGKQYLDMEINVSNPISSEGAQTPAGNPVLRNLKQKVSTALVEGKPILVASMDDMNSKKTFQVEVTTTRLN